MKKSCKQSFSVVYWDDNVYRYISIKGIIFRGTNSLKVRRCDSFKATLSSLISYDVGINLPP